MEPQITNRGIPICCVSIAMLKNLNPIIGVIYDFNNNDIYKGGIYSKATKNNKPIHVSSISDKSQSILLTGLPVNTDYSSNVYEIIY